MRVFLKLHLSYRNTADIPPGIYKFTLLSENAQSIETYTFLQYETSFCCLCALEQLTFGCCFKKFIASSKWSRCVSVILSPFLLYTATERTTKPLLASRLGLASDTEVGKSNTAGKGPFPGRKKKDSNQQQVIF